jgi:hypothetical protein
MKAMAAAAALTGKTTMATRVARKAVKRRVLCFMFEWNLLLP